MTRVRDWHVEGWTDAHWQAITHGIRSVESEWPDFDPFLGGAFDPADLRRLADLLKNQGALFASIAEAYK